jgi:hypothetical protein
VHDVAVPLNLHQLLHLHAAGLGHLRESHMQRAFEWQDRHESCK